MTFGAWVGKYRILREIGGSGLTQVYEAEDRTIDRKVVLKVLAIPQPYPNPKSPSLSSDSSRKRIPPALFPIPT